MYTRLVLLLVLGAFHTQSMRVSDTEEIKGLHVEEEEVETEVEQKQGEAEETTIRISFNQSTESGMMGNAVGRLMIQANAQLTNRGFFASNAMNWQPGSVLGKSDNYVWQIPGVNGMPAFTFDHGVSDIVLGDAQSMGQPMGDFRPEFEEVVYGAPQGGHMGHGHYQSTPDQALHQMLREEQKESTLTFGNWMPDGYFTKPRGRATRLKYNPRLRLKDPSAAFMPLGRSGYTSATLIRPSILDIDNLFSVKASVPNTFRSAQEVAMDQTYKGQGMPFHGGGKPGGMHGGMQPHHGGMHPPHGGMQPHHGGMQPQHGGMQPHHGGMQPQHGGMQPHHGGGMAPHHGGMQPHHGSVCRHKEDPFQSMLGLFGKECVGSDKRCATVDECRQLRGRWKNKYCTGAAGCGCCKEIGMHTSFIQDDAEEADESERALTQVEEGTESALPVDIKVEWLTPVLQKYRCVSVAPQYAKTGGSSLYIAMGWDTESGVSDLDLDLSLVALDGKKTVLQNKMVYYQAKRPPALNCGQYGYAMQAFNDDRSGDEPGDDELVKLNLACLAYHQDVEAVLVMVNIYSPSTLTWSNIDSAYLRIISGGRETNSGGNFFIHDAEAVRSFVRLSGNDLKADPNLKTNGLAVGLFFRQRKAEQDPMSQKAQWAFAALMKGVPGRNVVQSIPHIKHMLSDLVYPANEHWDQTQEMQQAHASGAFGKPGLDGKMNTNGLISSGQLPCVASRKDMAMLHLGGMTNADLVKISNGQAGNGKIPENIQNLAGQIAQGGKVADNIRQMADAVDKMEDATTDAGRLEIAKNMSNTVVQEPTQDESNEALEDLDSLFDDI